MEERERGRRLEVYNYPEIQHDTGFEDIQGCGHCGRHSTCHATAASGLVRVELPPM